MDKKKTRPVLLARIVQRISSSANRGDQAMNHSASMIFNILIKKEDEVFVAHCMELDIVATGQSIDEATNDLIDLVVAQLEYAFMNDNLDHLYRPAPLEVWRQFYTCERSLGEREIALSLSPKEASRENFMPPYIIAKMCEAQMESHV
jgi:hypothetical protein